MEKAYKIYKDSGIEWIGKIPESWDVTSIKNLLEIPITDGPHTTPKLYDTGIPFISAEAIRDKKIDFNRKRGYISEKDYELFSKKYVPKRNDVYMVKSGATTGNIGVVETDEKFTIWSPLAVFRANNEKAFHRYLIYFLQSDIFKYQVELNWSYGTQQNIGMGVLSNLKITYPNTKVQNQISAYLDYHTTQIDQLIAKKESLILKLQEQKKVIINDAVTKGLNKNVELKDSGIEWLGEIPKHWEVIKLKYLANITRGAILRPVDEPSYFDDKGDWYYLNISDVTKVDKYLMDAKLRLSSLGSQKSARVLPNNLIMTASATIGKMFINKIPVCVHDGFIPITDIKCNIDFLFHYLSNPQLYVAIGKSNTQKNIYLDEVKNMFISLPPIKEQQLIFEFLEDQNNKFRNLIDAAFRSIQKLKDYRKSLISEAVTGKIDVRDWQNL